jgi:ribosomal-protein-alanine N-acetyltransferase
MAEWHLEQVLRIERRSFGSPWTRNHFLFELRDNRYAENWVVELEDRVLGYACVWSQDDELKINNIAIDPQHRGRGLGRWLLRALLARARETGCRSAELEVRPSNAAALALYCSEGFQQVGRRKGYYSVEKEDALVLRASLEGP